MPKAIINAYDAYALLNSRKLYPKQLSDVLIDELDTKKVLCISDTTDVLLKESDTTKSIAHSIEKAKIGPKIEVIQSDYKDFAYYTTDKALEEDDPKFGAHLPQNEEETRREYVRVDSTQLEENLRTTTNVDLILGRSCLCACNVIQNHLCGGIAITKEAQKAYISSLVKLSPSLMVLSASQAMFTPIGDDEADVREKAAEQAIYKKAQANLKEACDELNKEAEDLDSPYRFAYVPPNDNFTRIFSGETMENGYMLVAYDTRKVDFKNTVTSLQVERAEARRIAEEISRAKSSGVPSAAFFKQAPQPVINKAPDQNEDLGLKV